ncbi:hypothetical protein [Prauserella flavalba]|uniref:Uncharacterized protein n=1 Tax=Prauserella flavalba TaxID=1477506 RepID=A0A318LV22_9PSEU|nr:hypothetical protein [Prauserella flavalba]PXY28844.1 hypothetical protein BA062_23740 [Prauserella flavalba]
MASLFNKVARFAKSPQGRRMIAEAQRMAKDPHKRKQAMNALNKLRGKGPKGGGTPPYRPH